MVVLQAGAVGSPLAIAGTVGAFALFLSVTAHIAARNVLGDVEVKKAFAVGPLPAAIAVVSAAFGVNPFLAIAVAVAVDAAAISYLYGRSRKLTAYVTAIHIVVSIILGALIFSLVFLIGSAPS
jgi:ABC-type siderophore export system fused ATPase/permease subunit